MNMPFLSPLLTLRHMLCLTDCLHKTVYISQNMHYDVVLSVFIHPCTKKRRRAQFSIQLSKPGASVSGPPPPREDKRPS